MPFHLFKGVKTLYYNGSIYYNVDMLPKDFDKSVDLYFSCDCEYPKWKNVEKICNKH